MSFNININTQKYLSISNEEIIKNINAIKARHDAIGKYIAVLETDDTGTIQLTVSQKGYSPNITILFNPNLNRLIVNACHNRVLMEIKGLMGPIPVNDLAQLLRLSTANDKYYSLNLIDASVSIEIVGEPDEFTSFVFGESDFYIDQLNRYGKEIMKRVYDRLERPTNDSFSAWCEDIKVRKGKFVDYLPVIENINPGFTKALENHFNKTQEEYIIQRGMEVTRLIGVLSDIYHSNVLLSSFNTGHLIDNEISGIVREAECIGYKFKWPLNVHPELKSLLTKAINKRSGLSAVDVSDRISIFTTSKYSISDPKDTIDIATLCREELGSRVVELHAQILKRSDITITNRLKNSIKRALMRYGAFHEKWVDITKGEAVCEETKVAVRAAIVDLNQIRNQLQNFLDHGKLVNS